MLNSGKKICALRAKKKLFIEKDEKENVVKVIVKCEQKLDTELDGSMLFNDIYRITNDTNFQFKILHHILPNNKLLHKMGIKNSALCNFCNQEEDSILHYLWGPRGKEILNFI
jgi:hypothetical protein